MPHTNRKKRNLTRTAKPVKVTLDNGWTVITRSNSRHPPDMERGHAAPSGGEHVWKGAEPWNVCSEGPPIEDLTLQQLAADFEREEKRYLETECSRIVRRHVHKAFGRDEVNLEGSGGRISNAVCLALGSLCHDADHRVGRFWQLAMFVDVVRQLKQIEGSIDAFAQEPAFRPLDITLLKSRGITVVEDPAAAQVVGSTSFVFAAYMYAPKLLCEILVGKKPALFMNPDLSSFVEANRLTPLSDRHEQTVLEAERFEKQWRKEVVPEPQFPTGRSPFPDFRIYWREEKPHDIGDGVDGADSAAKET